MSIVKRFITESIKRTEIDEFLQKKLERAGYGGVNLSKTPLGTHVVIYAMRPGLVIGRGGETIKELAAQLEHNFKVSNPQISVSEIEVPEFNAHVVANRVSSALERGVHFRRAGFWALNQVMEAGALGAEIVISGKLTTERARFEKFKAGHFPIVGEPAARAMRTAEAHVQLKPGIIGIRVKLMPPDAHFPDKVTILPQAPPAEETPIIVTQTTPTPVPTVAPTAPAPAPAKQAPPVATPKAPVKETAPEAPKAEQQAPPAEETPPTPVVAEAAVAEETSQQPKEEAKPVEEQ
ncbi:30S ribosomal protein S3 [Candidatus Bathycorpusculum sp.]|uniref:30S ribosomal protein S3 n=1 Tax=Candidatus Bathycorpusculum sp. TaxID=2994959 RepID=UPI0028279F3E|nr:30S ribosomal protein S3 [Candidatus Termitimicrobium sp.]MCL2685544.1 30S ribosomal protein S3 [Candidatus Termitimicrobium sp.]